MTINVTGMIRRVMGWCPQKSRNSSAENLFNADYVQSVNSLSNYYPDESMDVPIQMSDWRAWTVLLCLMGLIISSIKWNSVFIYVIPLSICLTALLFILSYTKLTVGIRTLRISTLIPGDIIIPLNTIRSVETFENYGNRHRLRGLVSLVVVIAMSINLVFTSQNHFMNTWYVITTFIFFYVFYFSVRISNYHSMIRMNAGGRDIMLYPRNEHDFLILKGITPPKSD